MDWTFDNVLLSVSIFAFGVAVGSLLTIALGYGTGETEKRKMYATELQRRASINRPVFVSSGDPDHILRFRRPEQDKE